MSTPEDTHRRQTPTERQHELLRAALERSAPAAAKPSFHGAQVKAVGGATVFEWDVHMPVCDEYPTAELAFAAFLTFTQAMRAEFPTSDAPPPKTPAERESGATARGAIASKATARKPKAAA